MPGAKVRVVFWICRCLDAEWTIVGNSPVSRTYTSRQEFLDVVINPFNARLSGRLVPAVRCTGCMPMATRLSRCSMPKEPPGTANHTKNTYTWYLQMRDGRIVNVIAFFDTIEFTDFWTRITPEQVVHRTTSWRAQTGAHRRCSSARKSEIQHSGSPVRRDIRSAPGSNMASRALSSRPSAAAWTPADRLA